MSDERRSYVDLLISTCCLFVGTWIYIYFKPLLVKDVPQAVIGFTELLILFVWFLNLFVCGAAIYVEFAKTAERGEEK